MRRLGGEQGREQSRKMLTMCVLACGELLQLVVAAQGDELFGGIFAGGRDPGACANREKVGRQPQCSSLGIQRVR